MLEKSLRIVVEAIKKQPYITIELPTGDRIKVTGKKGEIYVAFENQMDFFIQDFNEEISADDILSIEIVEEKKGDERKGEILNEIAMLGEKISDLIEEYDGNIIIEIDQYEVLLRNSGDILYRK